MFHLISVILKVLRRDERVDPFGSIQLSENNIVYLTVPSGLSAAPSFGTFKKNIYFYSEFMNTPCAALLDQIENQACLNARRGGNKAREHLIC